MYNASLVTMFAFTKTQAVFVKQNVMYTNIVFFSKKKI